MIKAGKVSASFWCSKIIYIICSVLFLTMLIISIFTSNRYDYDLSCELPRFYRDNVWINVFFVLFSVIVLVMVNRYVINRSKNKKNISRVLALCLMVITGIVLTVWVSISNVRPIWDQMQVYMEASNYLHGNYETMQSIYMRTCTHQYGYIFFAELLLHIHDSYKTIQYINIIFVLVIEAMSYFVADELFMDETVSLLTVFLVFLFTPLSLYVNFVYGDIPSIAFSLLSVFFLLKWNRISKWYYLPPAIMCITIAGLIRKNSLVLAIAIAIILVIKAIDTKRWKVFLVAAIILLMPLLASKGVNAIYEARSGYSIEGGMPTVNFIAMGMHDSGNGAGAYDNFNESTYATRANFDVEKSKEISINDIKDHVSLFKSSKRYALDFYSRKFLEQWNEGTFGSLLVTAKEFDKEPEGIVNSVYYGTLEKMIIKWQDLMLSLIYFGGLVYSVCGLFNKNNKEPFEILMLICLIGGVFFSMIWEAKARYVYPYIIYLMPLASVGIIRVSNIIFRGKLSNEKMDN